MARQNVPIPILTIERVAPFFWYHWDCGRRMQSRWNGVQDFYRVAIEDRGDQVCAKADIRQKRKDCSQ